MPRGGGLIAGVDLGGTKIRAGIADPSGRVRREAQVPTPRRGPAADLGAAVSLVRRLAAARQVRSVVIGVPGVCANGVVRWAPNLPGWHGVRAATMLRRALGCRRVTIENDADLAAQGEAWRGGARGSREAIVFTIGTGIGGGLIVGGRVARGCASVAGAVGWMRVGGRRLEDVASGPAIARAATRIGARRAAARAGEALGEAVASLVSVLNPERVVLGGGVMEGPAASVILRAVRRAVRRHAQPLAARAVRVVRTPLGNRAGMLGAIRAVSR